MFKWIFKKGMWCVENNEICKKNQHLNIKSKTWNVKIRQIYKLLLKHFALMNNKSAF